MPEQSDHASDNVQAKTHAAAEEAPRRSSAQAAALTVGASPARSSQNAATGATKLSAKTKGGIIALAAISLLLICVGAFALSGSFGLQNVTPPQTQQEQQVDTQEAHAHVSSQAAESAQQNQEQAENNSDQSDRSGESASAEQQANADASSDNDGSASVNASSPSSSGVNTQSANSQAGGSDLQPSGSAGQPPAQSNAITVAVSVDSSAAGSPVSASGTFSFNAGATPYDALCALGLSVNARGTSYGTYVSAIGGLAEKEHGGMSGWMYSVNGSTPMTACSNYILSNGDTVVWYYVTG